MYKELFFSSLFLKNNQHLYILTAQVCPFEKYFQKVLDLFKVNKLRCNERINLVNNVKYLNVAGPGNTSATCELIIIWLKPNVLPCPIYESCVVIFQLLYANFCFHAMLIDAGTRLAVQILFSGNFKIWVLCFKYFSAFKIEFKKVSSKMYS